MQNVWQPTIGWHGRGTYRRAGVHELYVRFEIGTVAMGWWFVDGHLGGRCKTDAEGQAACESAVRAMDRTHTGQLAAPAYERGAAASA